jgi:hypothetical protein
VSGGLWSGNDDGLVSLCDFQRMADAPGNRVLAWVCIFTPGLEKTLWTSSQPGSRYPGGVVSPGHAANFILAERIRPGANRPAPRVCRHPPLISSDQRRQRQNGTQSAKRRPVYGDCEPDPLPGGARTQKTGPGGPVFHLLIFEDQTWIGF